MEKQIPKDNQRIQYIVLLVSIVLFAALSFLFWDYSIDDAFITFKYAQNVANGNGFVFNIGTNPVEGFSNLLWLLILSLFYNFGFTVLPTAKILGLLSMLLSGVSWFFYYKKDSRPLLWLAGPLFLICPLTIFWGVSGLELGLHCLLISLVVQLALKRSFWSFLPAVLLVLNRPEGVAIVGTLFFILALSDYSNSKLKIRYYLYGFLAITITISLLTLFRYVTFGYPLPNTFYAKTVYKNYGFYEFLQMMLRLLPLSIAFLWAVFEVLKKRFRDRELTIVVGLFFVQTVISASVDPVMNYMFRYLIPFLPLLILITLFFAMNLIHYKLRYLVIVATIVSFILISLDLYKLNVENRKIMEAQQDIIGWLNTKPPNQNVSLLDMGRIPYYTKHTYKDLWGLVDERIGHRGFSSVYEFLLLPDYFIFVGNVDSVGIKFKFWRDRNIADIEQFPQCYKIVNISGPKGVEYDQPGYFYLTFEKRPEAENIVNSLGAKYWQKIIQ